MNIAALSAILHSHSARPVRFVLPSAVLVPAHVHVTEVGHVTKRFIDCGGTVRAAESALLQLWFGESGLSHRLPAGKLARILEVAAPVLGSAALPAEVEYDIGAVAQFSIATAEVDGDELHLQLKHKHTDCLARSECGTDAVGAGAGCCGGEAEGSCC